jgi:hypothetical protein
LSLPISQAADGLSLPISPSAAKRAATPFTDAIAQARTLTTEDRIRARGQMRLAQQMRGDAGAGERAVALARAINDRNGQPIPFPGSALPLMV